MSWFANFIVAFRFLGVVEMFTHVIAAGMKVCLTLSLIALAFLIDEYEYEPESVAVRMSMHSNHSQDHTCASDRVQNCEFCTCLPSGIAGSSISRVDPSLTQAIKKRTRNCPRVIAAPTYRGHEHQDMRRKTKLQLMSH